MKLLRLTCGGISIVFNPEDIIAVQAKCNGAGTVVSSKASVGGDADFWVEEQFDAVVSAWESALKEK